MFVNINKVYDFVYNNKHKIGGQSKICSPFFVFTKGVVCGAEIMKLVPT